MNKIEESYWKIMNSVVFRRDGESIDLPQALEDLASEIHSTETDEKLWSLGEFTEASLGDLIAGAYWALAEWHAGQWSPEYSALCALGKVFSPGISYPPTKYDPAESAYEMVGEWFRNKAS